MFFPLPSVQLGDAEGRHRHRTTIEKLPRVKVIPAAIKPIIVILKPISSVKGAKVIDVNRTAGFPL
jgi:hypothetical protein